MESKKILILSNHFITLYNFRRELIARLISHGHKVYISMPEDERNEYFAQLGCEIIVTPMSRRGMNPAQDIALLHRYKRIMREVQPDIIFSYTIKPNIYGTMASNALHYKQVCNVTGTGPSTGSSSPGKVWCAWGTKRCTCMWTSRSTSPRRPCIG